MLTFRAEPINRDIAFFLDSLSPKEASRQFAELATEQINLAKDINRQALGRDPVATTYVDGTVDPTLRTIKLTSVVFTEFELALDLLLFISTMLDKFSPVKTGRYQKSHILFADGVEMSISMPTLVPQVLGAEEYVFVNTQPYARKIERGLSQQAPDGVYQVVASLARRQFGKIAKITFSYRTLLGGAGGGKSERNPAIIVRLGT